MTTVWPSRHSGHIDPTDPPPPDTAATARVAASYVLAVMVFAIGFLLVGSLLYDPAPTWVIVVTPFLVLAGAGGSLWRTYRTWQGHGRWQVWQGASWFLLAMFLLTLGGTGGMLLER